VPANHYKTGCLVPGSLRGLYKQPLLYPLSL
jgi:hypothetical protein